MSIPQDLRYTKDHEWIRVEGDAGTVGITDHAQEALGGVVFVEQPQPGKKVEAGKQFGVIESTKAVSELYAPVSGEVLEVNAILNDSPELVNDDPYGQGWIIKVRLSNRSQVDGLLTAAQYEALVASESSH